MDFLTKILLFCILLPNFFEKVARQTSPALARFLRAHERAPERTRTCTSRTQRVCFFCLHPSRRGLSSLIARAVGVKTPPIFRPSPPLPACAARVKVEAQKAFTPYALTVNALTQVGEEVKEKNENLLDVRVCAGVRVRA